MPTSTPVLPDAQAPVRDSRAGWVVVAAAMIGVALGLSPLPFYTIGMFAPELQKAFGWSFASLMGSLTVMSAVVMLVSPVAGLAIDRYGARPVALISLFLFGLTFMSLALTNGVLWIYYAQWVAMAIAGAGTLSATWTYVVNGWFDKHRGLALGIASTGTGLTGFLIKPFAAWLIIEFGWRWAFVAVGMLPIVIGVPVVALLFHERTSRSRTAAADIPAQPLTSAGASEPGMTLREAFRSRYFWIMALAFLLVSFALTAPTPNLENILRTFKFDLMLIGQVTAMFGLAVIAGRIIGGLLLDRFWAPGVAAVVLLIPAVGSWLLSRETLEISHAYISIIALGLGAGFEFDLLAFLIARYFGRRAYGTIYGSFYAVIALGGGLGPVVYGYAFDRMGHYDLVMLGGAGLLAIGGLIFLLLGPYPHWEKEKITG